MRKAFLVVLLAVSFSAQTKAAESRSAATSRVCGECIRAHEEFLASDALRGRGSGTQDEHKAATYIASELRRYGIAPAGDQGGYLQQASIIRRKPTGPPQLKFHHPGHEAPASAAQTTHTWNVLGVLQGSDPALRRHALLLSAHLDHLGIGAPLNGDNIYNGADDDASGVTAVLELARVLGAGKPPRRTVIFALFGSEELGGLGSAYFIQHPPVPLSDIAVNLEFEMIGRRDPAVPDDTLWLTGWERSNVGPGLAAHGAHLVADPRPSHNFFARSDNYLLARKGVVAQTISSFGMHGDYHRPSDDLAHIDFGHMTTAIGSLFEPLEWLVNSDFAAHWVAGGRP